MNKNLMLQGATKLTKNQMKNVKGGNYAAYCGRLQAWAGTYAERATSEQWDDWANKWETYCSN